MNFEMESVEEELERIIMVAEKISKKALSATEYFAGNTATKRQKAVKRSKRSSLACCVLSRSCKNLRSDRADNSLVPLHRQPRLSPLAARAALAAAVTPLRQGSKANDSEKSQELGVHSGVHSGGPASRIIAESNDASIHVENGRAESASIRRDYEFSSGCNQMLEMPVNGTGSSILIEWDQAIELVVDIPIHSDLFLEKSVNLFIDIPVLENR